jgi:hypothetical protein
MAVEERRRVALHRAAAGTWGEEVADTLVELVAPSGHEPATRQDIEGVLAAMSAMDERWDERFRAMDDRLAALDQRWDERFRAMDDRLAALDQRWDERLHAMDDRIAALDQRWDIRMDGLRHELIAAFEHRIADAVTLQTRTLATSQLVALVVLAGLVLGLR